MPKFAVTPVGRQKVADVNLFNKDEFAVMDAVFAMKDPVEFDELSAWTDLDDDTLRFYLEGLQRKGYIKTVA